MLSYATVGSNQLEKAKAFYDELLPAAGITTRERPRNPILVTLSADGPRVTKSSQRPLAQTSPSLISRSPLRRFV
jgi:hypothetical protein